MKTGTDVIMRRNGKASQESQQWKRLLALEKVLKLGKCGALVGQGQERPGEWLHRNSHSQYVQAWYALPSKAYCSQCHSQVTSQKPSGQSHGEKKWLWTLVNRLYSDSSTNSSDCSIWARNGY